MSGGAFPESCRSTSGSTPGRPFQCRRAKVWVTKNPGCEGRAKLLATFPLANAVPAAQGLQIVAFSAEFRTICSAQVPGRARTCLDLIQLLSKNRASAPVLD